MKRALPMVVAALACIAGAVQAKDIVIGQSLGLTGGGAEVAKQYLQGAKCYFDSVNKEGGIRNNRIRLVSLDDGGNREKTVENTKKLLAGEKVTALFGYTAAAGAQAVFPLIEQASIPLVGIASGGLGVHDQFRKMVFHVRASYYHELEGAVDLLRSSGLAGPDTTFAFVYNQDAKANLGAFADVMARKKAKTAGSVGIDRNSTDMKAPVETILKGKPGVVIAITTAKAMGALIKEARRQGYTGTIVSSSFAGDPLVREAGSEGVGTIVIHVVPDPLLRTTAITSNYLTALAKCQDMDPPSASGLEGYISARVLVEGLRRAGANLTSAGLVTGLESIQKLDLGGVIVDFSPTDHEGMRFVDFLIISKSGKLKK
ncbi:ABC transporter substrate-binding protein [Usitatibacter palustris]|uniref:Leucine-binding protein domain-containing protein n=1 Tax=Usitatibacter palustris TaxID=2732487 RepID=A0A6M4HAH5_9PROT|nr:ABC transporter substrate-binding protein [Usitatibacter palustris]QJR15047.1 hypothetical protein DSM104440_01863 [Usitatibacter palustris]